MTAQGDSTANAILDAKEARWARRLAIAAAMDADATLLTLTLRVPAPLRAGGAHDSEAKRLFGDLEGSAHRAGFQPLGSDFRVSGDGPEGYLTLRGDARAAKEFAVEFEENHPWGELADLDVMGPGGQAIGRGDLGLPPRRCLVCGEEASLCVVERRHDIEELRARVERIFALPAGRGAERP